MQFKKWLEDKQFTGITPKDLDHWAKYAQHMSFKTPEEAREWVFNKRQHNDRQSHVSFFGGPDGEEYNRAFANAIPVYQSGKYTWKVGKRVRYDRKLNRGDFEVRRPDIEYLNLVAQANGETDYKFHPVEWIPIRFTVSDNDAYATQPREVEYIRQLAYQIKQNKWIEAVVYDYADKHIIEGQHRARAMKVLGFGTVPGIGIEYL